MAAKGKDNKALVAELNKALGWELRAQAMYAHYAAYVKGLESMTLQGHFEEEAKESFGHAAKVRNIIAELGAEATTNRDATPIAHTTSTKRMLEEALKTEKAAAAQYEKILALSEHPVHRHDLVHIMMDELRAVVEVETLLGR
jgi:bacterioferritin (cytochrome b1)